MGRLFVLAAMLALGAAPVRADSLADIRAGNTAFSEGRNEAAIQAYAKAILAGDLDPEALAVTFNNRGVAYSELGDFDQAIRDYGKALELRPEDRTAVRNLRIGHSRRAAAAASRGDYDTAINDYTTSINLEPGHAPSYLRRGQIYLERGDVRPAIADFTKAREVDPANQEAAELLGKAEATLAAATARREPAVAAAQPQAGTTPAERIVPEAGPASPPPALPPSTAAAEIAPPPAAVAPPPPPKQAAPTPQPAKPLPSFKVAEQPEQRYRVTKSVNLREGPGNEFPRNGSLAENSVVSVVGASRGWFLVQLKSGKKGFAYERYFELAAE